MYLFCPKCHTQHPATGRCPKCSSRLLSPAEAADVMDHVLDTTPPPIQTTYTRRVVVGTVVALGLHLAFREWFIGALELSGLAEPDTNLWVSYALRLLGAVFGGLLAGAGRPQGLTGGLIVGGVSGFAWLIVDAYPDLHLDLGRLGYAAAVGGVGGVCGVIGRRVWPAPIELPVPQSSRQSSLMKLKAGEGKKETVRPTSWVRIIVGATLAVCGVMAADSIRGGMSAMPRGLFNLTNPSAIPRIDAQIAGLLLLFAGMVAGAGTGAGPRHGLLAGLIAGVGLIAMSSLTPDGFAPPVQYVIDQLGLTDTPREATAAVGAGTLAVVCGGGWLGGQLLPPLARPRRRLHGF